MANRPSFVIVGAGLAGHSAALTLRLTGFDGHLVLIGNEPDRPYERPPLSKAFLQGKKPRDELFFQSEADYADHEIELLLGRTVTNIDTGDRHVALDDGTSLPFDKLLLATGASPIRLRQPGFDLPGVHYLRTIKDSKILGCALQDGGRRVLVVGAGFIGSEVAASARMLGNQVTLVDLLDAPLAGALGDTVGSLFAEIHRRHGVELRMGAKVVELRGDDQVEEAVFEDGSRIPCDVVAIGVGVRPNDELARGAGLTVENGIIVDEHCETSVPGIYAAGDVANWLHPDIGERLRVEHYDNAAMQGAAAARSMLGQTDVYAPLPYVWSDQYDVNLQYVGFPTEWHDIVVRGDVTAPEATIFFMRDGLVHAAATINRPRELRSARRLCESRALIDPAVLADPETDLRALSRKIKAG
jgi:3-phenylpropionate/trans-cinnamate dioxygenase ferredoxin reductase subunit